jgi:acetophenone carboxylase
MIFDTDDREVVAAPQGWAPEIMQSVFVNQRGLRNSSMTMDINAQGQGGRTREDGTNSMNAPWAALADCLETEWYEKDAPFVYLFRRHACDSGGPGRYRGGLGMESGWITKDMPFGMMTTVGGAVKVPQAPGLMGGYASVSGPCVTVWNSDVEQMIANGKDLPKSRYELIKKMEDKVSITAKYIALREFATGDLLTSQNPGGGGYGDVLERDPEMVVDDLKKGAISEWAADHVYRVAYDKETLLLDAKRTKELRKEAHDNRKKLGKKYDAFIEEWSQLKPPEEALRFFGPWEIEYK